MVSGVLLRTPDINSPMKELLADPFSVVLLAIFGTTLAPLCEELLFRGFLQPLLVRSFGAAAGILIAALAFGLLHLQEYGNSWRHGLLITLAGASFGWVRRRTGSTKAAVVMHATYNAVFFVALAAQKAAVR
jgi:membrane protease YdiL (CAAX protease family)